MDDPLSNLKKVRRLRYIVAANEREPELKVFTRSHEIACLDDGKPAVEQERSTRYSTKRLGHAKKDRLRFGVLGVFLPVVFLPETTSDSIHGEGRRGPVVQ
jgi:hypothetical protein